MNYSIFYIIKSRMPTMRPFCVINAPFFLHLYSLRFQDFCIFNHRVGVFLITELADFCSVIWRSSVWKFGAFLLGNLAKNHPYFIQIPTF